MPMTIPAMAPPESPLEDEEDGKGEGARVGWVDGGRAVTVAVAPVTVESPVAPTLLANCFNVEVRSPLVTAEAI